jgi:PKD repeat protein
MTRTDLSRLAGVTLALGLTGACTMSSQEPPPLSGPSEFALSISVSASPDVLPLDGASQSLVTVTARDAAGQPIRNLTLRASTVVDGSPRDFGTLSARSIATGSDGRATFVYTAPPAPAVAVDNFTVVDIVVTPIGTDFNNSTSRTAAIRLVPPSVIIPPDGLQPSFTFAPANPLENQTVLFDASSSQGAIVEYQWDFGDGGRGTGRNPQHAYRLAGTYIVRLTIVDGFGRSASSSQSISVGQGAQPTAAFVASPTNPLPGQQVFFNASASRAAAGRTLVAYRWDFGDGSSGSDVQTNHTYATAGTYNVTLVVTDDAGRTATVTQGLTVLTDNPIAQFTFTPATPIAGSPIAFSASASTAVPGRTIVSYSWNFGDGTSATGVGVSKIYATPGTRNVTLVVTDNQGKSGTTVLAVIVQ